MGASALRSASLALGALLPAACGDGGASEAPRPNVVLISIDTLRPDHLGCYGYGRDTSPRIDALAADGALFESAVSTTSWTLPAHAAMLTGLIDSVHGCTDTDRRLHPSRRTLAERLGPAGYETAGFFSGPYLHPVFGLSQGFDTWVDCTSYAELNDSQAASSGTIEGEDVWRRANDDVTNPRITEAVVEWLGTEHDAPFLLFVHMWDVHFDFVPPPPYDTKFDPDYDGEMDGRNFFFDPRVRPDMPAEDLEHLIALYDGEIAWTDEHVGRILDELDRLGLADDTLVVLTADHGTAFFEHGQRAHRNGLWDELVRVPLVMRWPGHVPPGERYGTQAQVVDIVPTVCDLALGAAPEDVMGRSLAPLFRGADPRSAEAAVCELTTLGQRLTAFRRPEFKVILDEVQGRGLVFDLRRDPREQAPVTDRAAPLVQAAAGDQRSAAAWLEAWRERAGLPEGRDSEVPEDVLRRLEQLGYVGEDGR